MRMRGSRDKALVCFLYYYSTYSRDNLLWFLRASATAVRCLQPAFCTLSLVPE